MLVHLACGIGDIVLATPLLQVLSRHGFIVDVRLDADYRGVGGLFSGWSAVRAVFDGAQPPLETYSAVLVAVPPFCWNEYQAEYAANGIKPYRPPASLFYRDARSYYLEFARFVGCDIRNAPYYFLPIGTETADQGKEGPIILAPGSKTGLMATKRWPFFAELSRRLNYPVVIGTEDDLDDFDGARVAFGANATLHIGNLTLREAAMRIATASLVVANDCGLGHIAGAVGVPTILLFGPTPDRALGALPPNVRILRSRLNCQPCWQRSRFKACAKRIDCLREISVDDVLRQINALI